MYLWRVRHIEVITLNKSLILIVTEILVLLSLNLNSTEEGTLLQQLYINILF